MFDRFNQPIRSDQYIEEAARLRKEAQGTPPGFARDQLLKRARQAETTAHMQDWLASPGLKPPAEQEKLRRIDE